MIHDDLLGQRGWMGDFIDLWRKRLPRIPFWCQLRPDSVLRIREQIPALSEIGLTWVSIGLESGSQRMLDFLQKGTTVEQNIEACGLLHENNVNLFANYILGLPTETKEDLDGTGRMLSIIKPEVHAQSTYTSYPGSYLYEWVKENDYWVPGDEHYSRIRYPYERMIRGVDYDDMRRRFGEWNGNYKSPLRAAENVN
jgi:anaerobic magnesium-protoporphyrin IX monomethyl ester cyclase